MTQARTERVSRRPRVLVLSELMICGALLVGAFFCYLTGIGAGIYLVGERMLGH